MERLQQAWGAFAKTCRITLVNRGSTPLRNVCSASAPVIPCSRAPPSRTTCPQRATHHHRHRVHTDDGRLHRLKQQRCVYILSSSAGLKRWLRDYIWTGPTESGGWVGGWAGRFGLVCALSAVSALSALSLSLSPSVRLCACVHVHMHVIFFHHSI